MSNFSETASRRLILLVIISILTFGARISLSAGWSELLTDANRLAGARQYDSALVIAKQALHEAVAAHGESDSSVAMVWHRISGFALHLNLPEADSLLREAVSAWNRVENANPIEKSKTLSNYGSRLRVLSDYSKAVEILTGCLDLRVTHLPADHLDIARTELKLGQAFLAWGKEAEAVPHLQSAIKIFRNNPKSELWQLSETFSVLSMSYLGLSQFERANSFADSAIAASISDRDSSRVAIYTTKLASALIGRGKYVEADSVACVGLSFLNPTDSLTWDEDRWISFSEVQNSRGIALWQLKRNAEAITCLEQSLRIKKSKAVHSLVEILRNEYTLANLYRDEKRYAEAESLYVSVLQQRRDSMEGNLREIAYSLYSLARLYALTGRYEEAFDTGLVACEMRQKMIDEQAELLGETDLLDYSAHLHLAADQCLSIAACHPGIQQVRARDLAEIILKTKGYVTDHIFRRAEPDSGGSSPNAPILLSQVGKALPGGSTLVEFYRYDQSDFCDDSLAPLPGSSYAVLVLRPDSAPQVLFIGVSQPIDSLVHSYRRQIASVTNQGHLPTADQTSLLRETSDLLYKLVVSPWQNQEDSSTLFISPDGALNNISFATLTQENGNYMIESRPIHYLSAARDLIRHGNDIDVNNQLVAFADPDFDAPPSARISRPEQASIRTQFVADASRLRSQPINCLYTHGINVARLPFTRREAIAACDYWNSTDGNSCMRYLDAIASEENFKRLAPGASAIYVATHGYFIDKDCALHASPDYDNSQNHAGSADLLKQSGFLLSGANLYGTSNSDAADEDGIVSAAEIAAMNFPNKPLVVLSSCESALGNIRGGEGVYGLRRSFLLAGARTVVSALWEIDDKSTESMMSQLFTSTHDDLPLRLRHAQLRRLDELRKQKLSTHPYSWGAFIATGDWR